MSRVSLKKMVSIALLSTIGFLIMLIAFPIPLLPGFLTMDFSDIPALIGALLLGPGAGVAIEAIKNILHILLMGSLTVVPVGELANFSAGSILTLVSWYFYHKKPSAASLAIGMAIGTLIMTAIMSIANYYVIFPSYALFLGFSVNMAVSQAQAVNHSIHSLLTLIVYSIMPFNIVKGAALTLLMIPVYARLRNYLQKRSAA
ncbi:ECF transporter S component [Sporolactobacillus putidus]|uniref:Riboflavin transporter n=1 Tax=Sporolactobacillus putidus TaxID=492735 RepID=A0A917W0D9_9BACL|nr:ECF transporter S component [Sporolactobacillus putidus]GGL46191.1 riboflavin transporter [Sporolactobacillus putidus]